MVKVVQILDIAPQSIDKVSSREIFARLTHTKVHQL